MRGSHLRLAPRLLVVCLLCGASAYAPRAHAHSGRSVSYSELRAAGREVDAALRIDDEDLVEVLGLDEDRDGRISNGELARGAPLVEGYVRNHFNVRARARGDGAEATFRPCAMRVLTIASATSRDGDGSSKARGVSVKLRFTCETSVDDVSVRCSLFQGAGFSHEHRMTARLAGVTRLLLFDGATREATVVVPLSSQIGGYLLHGVRHIALGYDHLVFLFALLLIGSTLRTVVAIVTSFTVAHSITLALGALEVVVLPTVVVESAIALTIAYVGAENLFVPSLTRRYILTFALGLVHGLGFAGALAESGLPTQAFALTLFSFNVGVELGQLAIVAAAWPLLRWAARATWHASAVRWLSVAVFVFGAVLFVLRVFFDVG